MRGRTWLAGAGLVLALGPGASSAMADPLDVRVGGGQLRLTESEPLGAPSNFGGPNTVSVSLSGGTYTITDTAGATASGTRCQQGAGSLTTVTCTASPAEAINGITAQLKGGDDSLTVEASVTVPGSISAGPGNDTIRGGAGNDTVAGEAGRDTIFGNGGDDAINTQGSPDPNATTGIEADAVNCGAGTDTATIDNRDGFVDANGQLTTTTGECETVSRPGPSTPPPPPPPAGGGGGQQPSVNQPSVNPIVQGGAVPSVVPPVPSSVACRAQTFVGTANADRFLGTGGGDRMVGLGGNDLMDGLAGEDCLFGGDGTDTMRGGTGDDRLSGGNGNDRGEGGAGNDTVLGSAGVDALYGGVGNDVLSGGLGSDKLYGEAGADRITGSAGNDRISAGAGNDRIVAGTGRDQVFGSSGNDLIDVRDNARDVVNCGAGRDTVVRDRRDVLRNCERRASRLPRQR